jgi:hypothetical protein
MSNSLEIPDALAHDWSGLMALVEATAQRQTVPCRNGQQTPPAWWTSDAPREQTAAATACGTCPVLAQCRAYGIDHTTETGVYGALTDRDRAQVARLRSKAS